MCCRLILNPVPGRIEDYLRLAGFARNEEYRNFWSRIIEAEKTTVRARLTENGLELSLYPSVTNYLGHADKRLGASLMFQTAALLAEKSGGSIAQHATVEGCMAERPSIAVVASYPAQPLFYQNVCRGFREVLLPNEQEVAEAVASRLIA